MTFYDREAELEALETAYESGAGEYFVVYGRRRIGKTALLKEFCMDRPHIYFLAAQESEQRQREKFVEQIAAHADERPPRVSGWEDALTYLAEKLQDERLVVVIDEFPYLVAANESLPSYFQSFIDEQLSGTDSMLVLCGSSVSTMESDILGQESPLHGRRTGQIDLQPFSFRDARAVISYEFEDAVQSYSVTGGTAMYLTQFDYDRSLAENIKQEILSPTAMLYNEPEFLLRTELRSPARYLSILEAIATGHTTPNEIAGATGIGSGPLSKYLQTLRRLRLISRETPVTASMKQSKRSQYVVADEFLRFWFRFVEPNRSSIEEAPEMVYEGTIAPRLADHVSSTFEDICQEAIWEAIRQGELGPYADLGRWWYGEQEIDIVGLAPNDDRILFGECKWTTEPIGHELVASLAAKADDVRWGPADRTEAFALFSRSGFVEGLADDVDEDWSLFGPEDLSTLL